MVVIGYAEGSLRVENVIGRARTKEMKIKIAVPHIHFRQSIRSDQKVGVRPIARNTRRRESDESETHSNLRKRRSSMSHSNLFNIAKSEGVSADPLKIGLIDYT